MNNLRFADDIDIIEQSNEKLQDTVDKLHTDDMEYSKDKDHGFGKKPEENDAKVNIDGQAIENVKSFILETSLHGIMTFPKTTAVYSELQSIWIMERQLDNDQCYSS